MVVGSFCSDLEMAQHVLDHARRHAAPSSWVQRRIAAGARAQSGLFTARVKPPKTPEDWAGYALERGMARGSAVVGGLDEQIQLALGEPAWWRCGERESRPDDGASRWEMKTRNQGQEFLVHRLAPLAKALVDRSAEGVLSGLTGRSVMDETGRNASDSRTGTGLTLPGPVDTAIAWCALWGLHTAPTVQRPRDVGQSAGVWPRSQVHPNEAVIPVYTVPVTPRAFSDVLSSKKFDQACGWGDDNSAGVIAARAWLKEHGVRALLRSSVRKTGSQSAPERQVLNGVLEPL